MNHRLYRRFVLVLAMVAHVPAMAAVFTVGSPVGAGYCTHGTIQAALDAANSSIGPDTIRITRSLPWTGQSLQLDTTDGVVIEGGYATCTQATPDATYTAVSGNIGGVEPVFAFIVPTGKQILMRRLSISQGNGGDFNYGGGVRFAGDGMLELSDTTISNNRAGYGGGIAMYGTGDNAQLVLDANVSVNSNTARYGGGGIYLHEADLTMIEPGSSLFNNEATGVDGSAGFGGGLYIHGNHRDSIARIASGGLGNAGAIFGNTGRYGGGVALAGYNDNAGTAVALTLSLYSTDVDHRGRIRGNSASVSGGGIYVEGDSGTFDGSITANANLWNAVLDQNTAPDGAAIRLAGDGGAYWNVNYYDKPAGAVGCTAGSDCGLIEGNSTGDAIGAIVRGSADYPTIRISQLEQDWRPTTGGVVVRNNTGGRLVHMDSSNAYGNIGNALIADNVLGQELFYTTGEALILRDVTLAGNSIGAAQVLNTTGADTTLLRSLLWQPGKTTLARSGGTLAVSSVMASEINSLGGNFGGGCGGVCSILADPRFVDPAHGDYTLRAASPAIDMAPATSAADRDANGNPRDKDLPNTYADQGVRDIGAFERQSLQPIVLNGDFDFSDLRLWTQNLGAWNAENKAGPANSGSWNYSDTTTTASSAVIGYQCIHLPGPGRYLLNGWGRSSGINFSIWDKAMLAWEFRRNGTNTCTAGTVDSFGEMLLSSTSAWTHPAQPAVIDVSSADFTSASSITVKLVVAQGNGSNTGLRAAFDGITLDVLVDQIFADGFE